MTKALSRSGFSLLAALLLAPAILLAQQPRLLIQGRDSAGVRFNRLKTDVKVIGNTAITSMEMDICNNSGQEEEGILLLPLPEGVSVSRYAIDIDGIMREAVPVEREKGEVVYESILHQNTDPGLLEKAEGNSFRTRVYPIPAHGCRHLIIGFEQLLTATNDYSFVYTLPLHLTQPLASFEFSITVASDYIPEVGSDCNTHLQFEEMNKVFSATVNKKNFRPDGNFSITIPKTPDAAEVQMKAANGQYYFTVNAFPLAKTKEKQIPDEISIIWDASLSGLKRNHQKELALLDGYIQKKKNLRIQLYRADISLQKGKAYTISGGHWEELRKDLTEIIYDGASDLYSLGQLPAAGEYLLFSDGLSSLGDPAKLRFPDKPVYTICAAASADYSFLKLMAGRSGGTFINLNELDSSAAVKYLTTEPLQFLGIRPNPLVTAVYPQTATPVINGITVSGISQSYSNTISLQFGYGRNVTYEMEVKMDIGLNKNSFADIEKIWAQQKIAELDLLYTQNKDTIDALGKKYGIVTRNSSLIVLEQAEDYLRYKIPPPPVLLADYTRLMNEQNDQHTQLEKDIQAEAIKYSISLQNWWKSQYRGVVPTTKTKPRKSPPEKKQEPLPEPVSLTAVESMQADSMSFSKKEISGNASAATESTSRPNNFDWNKTGTYDSIQSIAASLSMDTFLRAYNRYAAPPDNAVMIYDSLGRVYSEKAASPIRDRDHDGVSDEVDKCINDPGPASNYGCPLIPEAIMEKKNYTVAKSMLTPEGRTNYGDLRSGVANYSNTRHRVTNTSPGEFNPEWVMKELTPDKPFMNELKNTPPSRRYSQYLALREENDKPGFYLYAASLFFEDKDTATGLRVLSNIAATAPGDHESWKMLGYRLKTINRFREEVQVFKKILEWRPQDPQSYRDYALALADAGQYQQALDTLYLSLIRVYDEQIKNLYPGIEEVIIAEICNLVTLHGNKLDISHINKALISNLAMDVRVVLNWNLNDADIDLWVIEPDGEKCYFKNNRTLIGGRLSNDFTNGYGPEHYILKKAAPGKYQVIVDYYGNKSLRLAGRTTIMAEIYTHYGSASQQRKTITLQMQEGGSGEVLVGEFSF